MTPSTAPLRSALRALTARGRAFIAGGLTAAVCGFVLGERDLVRIGALVTMIPLATAVLVSATGQRLSLARRVTAPVVQVGQSTLVQLDLANPGRRTGLLLLEEQVPWALGHRPRFLIGWLRHGQSRHVQYPVHADVRGRYEIGPLMVRISDPFGMLALYRSFPRTSTLVVVPVVEPLPSTSSFGAWTGTGDNRPQPFSVGSAADSTVREYRVGDDLRRVHWRSTARTGELMVRREEQPWQSHCTLFIDNRTSAHRGAGPDSSLERAVTVAASVAVHLSRLGYRITLLSADGLELDPASDEAFVAGLEAGGAERGLLEHLACLPSSSAQHLAPTPRTATGPGSLFVAVLGALDETGAATLIRMPGRGAGSCAITLDVDTWTSRHGTATGTGTAFLRARGWRAVDLPRSGSLGAAWKELGR